MAKWSDLASWCGPTVNQGGKMSEQRGVVLHIAEGSYDGTIAWQKNPSAQVSSHFIAAKDGRACQMVDTATVAWTQANGNGRWLSIENEGSVPDKLTDHQMEFAAQILAKAHKVYGVPLQIATSPNGRGLGHHSMGCDYGWGHCSCPGTNIINQKSAIVARAKEIVEGTMPLTDDDVTKIVNGLLSKKLTVTDEWKAKFPADPGIQDGTISYETALKSGYFWDRQAEDPLSVPGDTSRMAALEGKVEQILAILSAGVPIPGAVNLTPESVAAVADATADEIHNDPERDG